MTDIVSVVGSDSIAPVYQPDGRWCIWEMGEIYKGDIGLNKYVPKVNDYVIDKDTGDQFIVSGLNATTLISSLRRVKDSSGDAIFTETDVLFGGTSNTPTDTYRIYIDKTVTPATLAVDKRCKIYGSEAKYAKIFKGNHLTPDSHVVSRVYDNNQKLISEDVELELVAIDNHTNYHIRTVKVCNTLDDLLDGEIVTIVCYGEGGYVVYKRQLIIENTSFIRSVNASLKYISSISLESTFLSATNDTNILFPFNLPQSSLDLVGVLNYSDGSISKIPVDGIKFRMYGINNYIHEAVGQKLDLVLAYKLDGEETTYSGVSSDNTYITRPYTLTTIRPDSSSVVKLFCNPVWDNSINKYILKWWLFTLSRTVYYDVTSNIKITNNTQPFDDTNYNDLQRLSVYLNLSEVSPSFKDYNYSQTVDVFLKGVPTIQTDSWLVAHESSLTNKIYGTGIKAKFISAGVINLANDFDDLETWLKNVYDKLYVLIDRASEDKAPMPTSFIVRLNTTEISFPIIDWNKDLSITGIALYDTINIRFISLVDGQTLQLGMAAMLVK